MTTHFADTEHYRQTGWLITSAFFRTANRHAPLVLDTSKFSGVEVEGNFKSGHYGHYVRTFFFSGSNVLANDTTIYGVLD